MSRPVQATSSSKPLSIVTTREIQVQRIAKEAAALSKQHKAQFSNLAALARTIQSYIPAGKQQRDYALLASALVDSAENYKNQAEIHDVAFSLVATDGVHLLDPDVRADILRCARTSDKHSHAKEAEARVQRSTAHH